MEAVTDSFGRLKRIIIYFMTADGRLAERKGSEAVSENNHMYVKRLCASGVLSEMDQDI